MTAEEGEVSSLPHCEFTHKARSLKICTEVAEDSPSPIELRSLWSLAHAHESKLSS